MALAFSVIKCQLVGVAYGEKKTIHRCVALEAVFMQMFVPGDAILHLKSKQAVFGD